MSPHSGASEYSYSDPPGVAGTASSLGGRRQVSVSSREEIRRDSQVVSCGRTRCTRCARHTSGRSSLPNEVGNETERKEESVEGNGDGELESRLTQSIQSGDRLQDPFRYRHGRTLEYEMSVMGGGGRREGGRSVPWKGT